MYYVVNASIKPVVPLIVDRIKYEQPEFYDFEITNKETGLLFET